MKTSPRNMKTALKSYEQNFHQLRTDCNSQYKKIRRKLRKKKPINKSLFRLQNLIKNTNQIEMKQRNDFRKLFLNATY